MTISPLLMSFLMAGHPITIDGQFQDWENVPVAYSDMEGDGMSADLADIKITYDMEFLFIYFSFHYGEFLMQDWNDFHLYIDADNDIATGLEFNGIGAELDWTFGQRQGTFYLNGGNTDIWQNDITLRIGPTITSSEFEIAMARNSDINTNSVQIQILTSEDIPEVVSMAIVEGDLLILGHKKMNIVKEKLSDSLDQQIVNKVNCHSMVIPI